MLQRYRVTTVILDKEAHETISSYLTNDPEWGPASGFIEHYQRAAVVGLHPGGTTDVQKVIMSRRIGIGRTTKEQAGRLR